MTNDNETVEQVCDGDMCKHFDNTQHCSKCKYIDSCQTGVAHNALKTHEREIGMVARGER